VHAEKAPGFGQYLKQMNLDSLESMKGGAKRQAEREALTPEERAKMRAEERERKAEEREERKRQRAEADARLMAEMAQVVELDPVRKEHRRKLGLED
jgi:hypothetical protein